MSKSTLKYVMMFLGVLIFIAFYFLVYMDYTTKTEALNTDIATLNTRFVALSGYNSSLSKYTDGISQDKTAIGSLLDKYYSAERPEDFIMLATDIESKVGLSVTGLSFSDPTAIYAIPGITDGKNASTPVVPKQLMCYKISSTINATMKYTQMKQALDYISQQKDVTKLSGLNLTYDSSTNLITGGFSIDKYYITGRDIPDHQLNIPYTDIGRSVLIGS